MTNFESGVRPADERKGGAKHSAVARVPRSVLAIVLLSFGGWTLVNADASFFTFTYPLLQDEFNISESAVSYIYAATWVAGGIATLIAGPMMDRWGRKPVYQLCLLITALGSVVTGAATVFAVMFLGRVFAQAGASTEWMTGQVMVAEEAPSKYRGRLIALAQIGWPVGWFLGSLLSLAVVPTLGWRALYFIGIIPVVMIFWARRAVPETARFQKLEAAARDSGQESLAGVDGGKAKRSTYRQLFAPDLRRTTILLTLWHFFYIFGFAGVVFWLPSIFSHYDLSLSSLYVTSAIATGFAALAYLLNGFIGEKIGRREVSAIFLGLSAVIGVVFALYGTTWATITVMYALFYCFSAGHIPSAVAYAAEVFPTRVRGTGTNLVAGTEWLAFAAAGLMGPILFNSIGYTGTLFFWLTVCELIAMVAILCCRRVAPNTELEDIAV